jgi:signal transduction histidine kinase
VAVAVHTQHIVLAGRLTILVAFSTLLDKSASYWSPGTVLLTIFFSFLYLITLRNLKEVLFALLLSFSIYLCVAIPERNPSPLDEADVYSAKLPAIITTLLANVIFIGFGYYIRRDQKAQDQHRLLLEQEHADILRQFLINVSHDLRTPLSNIMASVYLLRIKGVTDLENRLDALENAVDQMTGIFEDVVEMSRLEGRVDFELLQADLSGIVKLVVGRYTPQAEQKCQQLTCHIGEQPCYALVDQVSIERAIGNILDNALKFTPAGGAVTVRISQQQQNFIVEVADTGSGIAPEDIPYIFDRFYRADKARNPAHGKMGLGLAISKKIIELHGGHIEVESSPGKGSIFRIILPLATELAVESSIQRRH